MPTALDWIHRRAKKIRSGHPDMQWQTAVKRATADYYREEPRVMAGKRKPGNQKKTAQHHGIGTKRKSAPRKKAARKKPAHLYSSSFSIGATRQHHVGVAEHLKGAQTELQDEYGLLAVQLLNPAMRAADKRRIKKRQAEIKANIRELNRVK